MHKHQLAVREFHAQFGLTINSVPTIPSEKDGILRINLIAEEMRELFEAIILTYNEDGTNLPTPSLVGIADACGDLKYVIYGAALTYGVSLNDDDGEIAPPSRSRLCNMNPALISQVIKNGLEAVRKFIEATIKKDLAMIETSLNSLIYFTYSVEGSVGMNIDPVFDEIQKSNMSKLWNGPSGHEVKRRPEDGKILKPPTYSPADIEKVLRKQIHEEQNNIPKISTGEPSTLGTYLKIAKIFGPKAEKLIQDKINESLDKENEIVIQHESQMMILFASLMEK